MRIPPVRPLFFQTGHAFKAEMRSQTPAPSRLLQADLLDGSDSPNLVRLCATANETIMRIYFSFDPSRPKPSLSRPTPLACRYEVAAPRARHAQQPMCRSKGPARAHFLCYRKDQLMYCSDYICSARGGGLGSTTRLHGRRRLFSPCLQEIRPSVT